MADLQLARISDKVAGELYGIVYEPDTFVVREEDTIALRARMRRDRLKRGKPYKEFVAEFVKPEPPQELLYFGSWGDDNDQLVATHWGKSEPERVTARLEDLPLIMIPDRRVLKIEELSKRVRELEVKCGEEVQHKS